MNKGKEVAKPSFVSVIPPPIPAKLNKEVKEISKFFKKIEKPATNKLYAQALLPKSKPNASSSDIAINMLKIKEAFPNLPNKKIDTIQKVVNGSNDKPKPRLNMTTKGSSCKQVIVLINNELGKRFIKDSVFHITNINQALKSIKSSVCADFIYADNKGVIISTNNVVSNSDLQEIKKYIKNSLQTNDDNIISPQLPQSKSYLKIIGISYFINKSNVIRWVCEQTLGLGLVDRNRTVVLLLVYNRKRAHDLEVMWQSLEWSRRTNGLEGSRGV